MRRLGPIALLALLLAPVAAPAAEPTEGPRVARKAKATPKPVKKKKKTAKKAKAKPAAVGRAPDPDVEAWAATRARVAEAAATPRGASSSSARPVGRPVVARSALGLPVATPARGAGPGFVGFQPAALPASTPSAGGTLEAAPDAPAWGLAVDAALALHGWQPLERLPAGADRAALPTRERVSLESVPTVEVGATLTLPAATLGVVYASAADLGLGSLLDATLAFSGVPVLERLGVRYEHLDFEHGQVDLEDRADGALLQRIRFGVRLQRAELHYRLVDHAALFVRHLGWSLPRSLYLLDRTTGAVQAASDRLHHADHTLWLVGLRLERPAPPEGGLLLGVEGAIGQGSYDLKTATAALPLDGGDLDGGQVAAGAGYLARLGPHLAVGLRGDLGLLFAEPAGLPTGLKAELRAQGLDPTGLALSFGSVHLRHTTTLLLRVDL